MSFEGWLIFATFWAVFVTTPGPNAINCIQNGMSLPFHRALIGVSAILVQATAFLILSAAGITALIAASPQAFGIAKIVGAAVLILFGIRTWWQARMPISAPQRAGSVFVRALLVATINPKSVAGYLAAFSQFVQPDVPIWDQMALLMPTALVITALAYTGFTALGAGLGRAAIGAVAHVWVRRGMGLAFVLYGLALASTPHPARPA